jgi:CPA2 family monovalent cation:H+ antiporter-2
LTGKGTRTSIAAGMSLAQIGEFSFIIAGLGVSLGAVGPQVYPVAVSVSAITTLLTPALIRRSHRFASFIDAKLPKPLQTFVSLYESWIDRLRSQRTDSRSLMRRFARTLAVDVVAIAAIVIATSLTKEWFVVTMRDTFDLGRRSSVLLLVVGAGIVILPFCVSVLRTTARFGRMLGNLAIPSDGGIDLGRLPRRTVEAAVRLLGVLIAGSALLALTQPFLPRYTALIVFLLATGVVAIVFWRTTTDLQGHVRAAAQAVIEVLGAQRRAEDAHADPLEEARRMFPGMGAPVRYQLAEDSPAVGRTLAALELRSATGATVLAIVRGTEGTVPDAHTPLAAGDVLALAGTDDAIAAATKVLDGET